ITHNIDLSNWTEINNSIEILKYWNNLFQHSTFINLLTQQHWDKILCYLTNLYQSLIDVNVVHNVENIIATELLLYHSLNLLHSIGALLTMKTNDSISKQLKEEWIKLYSKEIYQQLLPLYVALPSVLNEFSTYYMCHEMVKSLCCSLCVIPDDHLISTNLKPLFHSDDTSLMWCDSLQSSFNHLYRLLSKSNRSIQYSSYTLLNKLLPYIAKYLLPQNEITDENERELLCTLPGSILESLKQTEESIGEFLNENDMVEEYDVNLDEQPLLSPSKLSSFNNKDNIIISELLTYKLLLNLIGCYSTVETRYCYTLMLQEKKLVDRILSYVLCLIPANPQFIDYNSICMTKRLTNTKSMFEYDIQLDPKRKYFLILFLISTYIFIYIVLVEPCSYAIPHLACSIYIQCLTLIPALVRKWYLNQTKRVQDAVDKVTQKYVSRTLIQRELDSVPLFSTSSNITTTSNGESGNVIIKKHSQAREITAIYTIETSRVEIIIKLPINFPLVVANIECIRHGGFSKEQWNKWMLQLKMNLTQNNGTIADGLLHWKRNIDKMMQGIEECAICYCILHTNNQLPQRTCRVCKKKFHDACLVSIK
ncbi:unnamed protein product, partial [Didymodactylos carnosus]